jgi:RNA polymerase sigma-70 factor (ECF subfamily)
VELVQARAGAVNADEADLAALRRGDEDAFARLVRDHRRELYVLIGRIVGAPHEAEEVLQETFVRAWRSIGAFRGDSTLRTWLTRIAINAARSSRSRRRDPTAPDGAEEALVDPRATPHERARLHEIRGRVRDAVETLPPRQREAVWLKLFVDLTYREASRVMGLSEGAVKAHVHQAVANLRRRLRERADQEGS